MAGIVIHCGVILAYRQALMSNNQLPYNLSCVVYVADCRLFCRFVNGVDNTLVSQCNYHLHHHTLMLKAFGLKNFSSIVTSSYRRS